MKTTFGFSKWFILPVVAFLMLSMLAVGITSANFLDTETSTGNIATAWTSTNWTQTTQAEFESGVVSSNVSTSSSPGSVVLAAPVTSYSPSSNSGNWTNGANGYSSNNTYATFTPSINAATNNPSSNAGSWANPANAYADGTNQANITSGSPSANHTYGNYGFSLGSNNITKVRVRADAWTGAGTAASQTGYVPTADADVSGTWQIAQTRTSTGSGNTTGAWTASAGNIWDVAAEVIWTGNDDSDWMNGTTDAGTNYKTFTFSAFSVPTGASIVSVGVYERTSDVGAAAANNIQGAIIVGGSIYNAGSRNPPGNTLQTWSSTAVWTTNPKTGSAWTVADVNGTGSNPLTQFGVYSTDGNPDVKVYSVFVLVIYTDSEYPAVDETTPDDSDFIIATANGYDYFTTTAFSVPTGSTINNLTLYYRAMDAAAAAGANGIRAAINVNGTRYGTTATNVNPGITWTNYSYAFTTNPNTGANWTVTDINGTGSSPLQQIGLNTADAAPDVGISMIYAEVNYTTASDEQIEVRVTWDNGTSWSAWYTSNTTGAEQTFWHDVTSETTWTPGKLSDSNFRTEVRAISVGDSGDMRLDWIPVEVTYSDFTGWSHVYGNYGISLTGVYVSAVEVGIEAFAASSEKVELEVSWNNGSSWSSKQTSNALTGADPNSTTWFDFTSATSWTPTLLNDSNFKARITYKDSGAYGQVSLDFIPVRITYRYASGTSASQVLNIGLAGSRWDGQIWDSSLPAGTSISFEVRASDTAFLKTDLSPAWTSVGSTSPVISNLPAGQYKQWRATLTTGDSSTPTLTEVRVYYDGG